MAEKVNRNGTRDVNAISDAQLARVKRAISAMAARSNPSAKLVDTMTAGKSDAEYRRMAAAFYAFCYEYMVYTNMAIDGKAGIEELEGFISKVRDVMEKKP
jgi:hypothetical protein